MKFLKSNLDCFKPFIEEYLFNYIILETFSKFSNVSLIVNLILVI